MAKLGGTKFLGLVLVVLVLGAAAFLGKFTGELGLYVSGAYVAFAGGNTLITRAALANGKNGEA